MRSLCSSLGLALGPGLAVGPGLALGLGLALAPSCGGSPNVAHCSLLEGDATCAVLFPSQSRPFCSTGCPGHPSGDTYGCVEDRPEDACYSPCGQGSTVAELDGCATEGTSDDTGAPSTTTTAPASSTSGDDTSADEDSTTGMAGCQGDEACAEPTPLCVEGACVSCSDAPAPDEACATRDPARPLCVEGACVACTADDASACTGNTPVCDEASGSCVGCTFHEQCPVSACHIEEGSCLPLDRVWHVDGDGTGCAAANGSEAAPYCTMAAALANVAPGDTGTLWVHARGGDAAYPGGFTLTGGRVVAVRGLPDERPRFSGGGVGAPVTITGGAVAYLDRGRVDGSAVGEAVQVVGAVLHLDGVLVVLNPGGGIALSNGAFLSARSSVLGANGSALVDAQALRATASTFALRYVTVAGNASATVASIACTGGSSGTVDDSIVIAIEPASIDCRGLVVAHSSIDSFVAGEGVVLRDAFDLGWFQAPGAGDFHLAPGHPFADVAQWDVGDPVVDLDGDPRPTRPGAADVAGADR